MNPNNNFFPYGHPNPGQGIYNQNQGQGYNYASSLSAPAAGNMNGGGGHFHQANSSQQQYGYSMNMQPYASYPVAYSQQAAAPVAAYSQQAVTSLAAYSQPAAFYIQQAMPSVARAIQAIQPAAFAIQQAADSDSSYEDNLMPWDQPNWIPTTSSGKQKTPNMVRNELQRYIDRCKLDGTSNQTRIIERMGVNSNSFRKFMDPKTYKDQWSATSNGTYWAGAKLLAQVAWEKELVKISGKRKSTSSSSGGSAKRTKSINVEAKLDALLLIQSVNAVRGVRDGVVYDTCPELVAKIKDFLQRDGMTKKNLLLALGDINSNSLNTFLSGKNQDQCANVTYKNGYVFVEKLRIYEGKSKSAARLRNEMEHPYGFSLERPGPVKYPHLHAMMFGHAPPR